jgi:hypothetical protein
MAETPLALEQNYMIVNCAPRCVRNRDGTFEGGARVSKTPIQEDRRCMCHAKSFDR